MLVLLLWKEAVHSFARDYKPCDTPWKMQKLMNFPLLVFVVSFFVLWFSARTGVFFHEKRGSLDEQGREDFGVVLAATLTLLGLIIGFSFSMAISRYDQRKNYEEEEANAIGTEYLRVQLLPAADTEKLQTLLVNYLDQRIQFYQARFESQLKPINADTAQLQSELWSSVRIPAEAQPNPVAALAVSGMNDVLNSQGYTQAAWWNRIPIAAWGLMGMIAVCSNIMVGYGIRRVKASSMLLLVLPLIVAISFLLIADIDSPRGGIIRIRPKNLISLSQSLHTNGNQ
jgi:hypothetical protein